MKTTKAKPLTNTTAQTARATVVVDFGNGVVKVKAKLADSSKWSDYGFPSYVAEVEPTSSSAFTVIGDGGLKSYLVGELSRDIPTARTGATAGKKAEFSNVLFLHALRQVFKAAGGEVHCDVIFTQGYFIPGNRGNHKESR